MSYHDDPSVGPPTDAVAPAFSHRVQMLLGQLQALAGPELQRELERLLDTLEQDMFRRAEQARNAGIQSGYLLALNTLRTHRHTLVERFTTDFAATLASLRPSRLGNDDPARDADFGTLRLVDHSEVTETNVLTAIARRHESRAGLPLLLLGQRFGVLAGRPAFDAVSLPVGPAALAGMLSRACNGVTGDVETRLQLYNLFDRQMLAGYLTLIEAMNALLDGAGVLPGLSFVPIQSRHGKGERSGKAPNQDNENWEGGSADADTGGVATGTDRNFSGSGRVPEQHGIAQPHYGERSAELGGRVDTAEERQALAQLQQLLASRRQLFATDDAGSGTSRSPCVALDTAEVDTALRSLQALRDDANGPRNPGQVREALLSRSDRQLGRPTSLTHQDDETFELLGLLYSEIGRELRHGSRSAALLERLQVPLLRVALQDRGFFVRRQHPARQLLDVIAEADTQWLDDSEGDADPRLDHQLHEAVDHVVENFQGDPGVFASAHQALSEQLESLARKAEVAQRRQVEAARGRDKLERAKQQAASAIQAAIGDTPVPKFLATLLEQAWTDVLSLILLRHGEESAEWREHLDATTRIIAANRGTEAPQSLQPRVTEALGLVGYQGDEATAIAGRLVAANDDGDDPATRTELAVKLKARARLGDNETPPLPSPATPRNAREEECFTHLRSLPFGSSIEFTINQQGDRVRRRLAWYSPITGRVLLLNRKGQRSDDQYGRESLDQIARLLAVGEARVIPADEQAGLVDRAWQAALGKLRSFGKSDAPAETTP